MTGPRSFRRSAGTGHFGVMGRSRPQPRDHCKGVAPAPPGTRRRSGGRRGPNGAPGANGFGSSSSGQLRMNSSRAAWHALYSGPPAPQVVPWWVALSSALAAETSPARLSPPSWRACSRCVGLMLSISASRSKPSAPATARYRKPPAPGACPPVVRLGARGPGAPGR